MAEKRERIELLDIVRGVAVLGILLMNIRLFSEPAAAYFNPLVHGTHEGLNKLWFSFQYIVADQKFMAIFSMLFGASTAIICDGLARRGAPIAQTYSKRIIGLFAIGLVHAYLLWPGDILVPYALASIIPFAAKNWRWHWSALAGIGLLVFGTLSSLGAFESISGAPAHIQAQIAAEYWSPAAEDIAHELAAYRGTYSEHFPVRAAAAFSMQTEIFLSWGVWRIGGMMLLGLALYRNGFLKGQLSARKYGAVMVFCLIAGFLSVGNGLIQNESSGWSFPFAFFAGALWNYWGSILVAIGYMAAVGLLLTATTYRFGFAALADVGRAALSNYLLQSVCCISVFYGFGGGLFGTMERYQTAFVVLGVWTLQLLLSRLWFKKHTKGPVEGIWNKITYSNWVPYRGS